MFPYNFLLWYVHTTYPAHHTTLTDLTNQFSPWIFLKFSYSIICMAVNNLLEIWTSNSHLIILSSYHLIILSSYYQLRASVNPIKVGHGNGCVIVIQVIISYIACHSVTVFALYFCFMFCFCFIFNHCICVFTLDQVSLLKHGSRIEERITIKAFVPLSNPKTH